MTERAIIRRRRILPLPGKVMVSTGDCVRSDHAVACTDSMQQRPKPSLIC